MSPTAVTGSPGGMIIETAHATSAHLPKGSSNSSNEERIFASDINMRVKNEGREERVVSVQVQVLCRTQTSPVSRKYLTVRLTDPEDPFFLYTLEVGEDDFHVLKTEQNLLVDFHTFPEKLIELFKLCIAEESSRSPKFVIDLVTNDASGLKANSMKSSAFLNIVEINPFKHLSHLSLKFQPGSDLNVKEFLADSLKLLKAQVKKLECELECSNAELGGKLARAEDRLSDKTKEIEQVRSESAKKISEFKFALSEGINAEKEACLKEIKLITAKAEEEKSIMEQKFDNTTQSLNTKIDILSEERNALKEELSAFKTKAKMGADELTRLMDSLNSRRIEIERLKEEHKSVTEEKNAIERICGKLESKTGALEAEIKHKNELLERITHDTSSQKDQKNLLEENAAALKHQNERLEETVKSASNEINKGNEIIQKLQTDLKATKAKLKMKTSLFIQQEKLLSEKEALVVALEGDKVALKKKEDETRTHLNEKETQLAVANENLEESKQLLKTNENVIAWLNKQINEMATTPAPRVSPRYTSPGSNDYQTPSSGGGLVRSFNSFKNTPSSGSGHPRQSGIPRPEFSSRLKSNELLKKSSLYSATFNERTSYESPAHAIDSSVDQNFQRSANFEQGSSRTEVHGHEEFQTLRSNSPSKHSVASNVNGPAHPHNAYYNLNAQGNF
eukprot:Nk52_evm31s207 gene=Nk52_evmTU31s207